MYYVPAGLYKPWSLNTHTAHWQCEDCPHCKGLKLLLVLRKIGGQEKTHRKLTHSWKIRSVSLSIILLFSQCPWLYHIPPLLFTVTSRLLNTKFLFSTAVSAVLCVLFSSNVMRNDVDSVFQGLTNKIKYPPLHEELNNGLQIWQRTNNANKQLIYLTYKP